MTKSRENVVVRELRYARKYAFAWDFRLGAAVGVLVGGTTAYCSGVRGSGSLLNVSTTIGIAILAVVIAAISILTAFLTEDYGIVLRKFYGDDLDRVFYPYKLIAFVSCLTVAVSILGLFLWPISGTALKAILLGFSLGLATWAIIGAFDLVRTTAGHGRLKLRLPEIQEAFDKEREKGTTS